MATKLEARTFKDQQTQATLRNYWHPLCMSEDIVEQPRAFTLLDESIVAFRDAEGVAAFKDLCIHRGTALSLGDITDGRLTCAYHGWQYDRTGACVRQFRARPEPSCIGPKSVMGWYGWLWIRRWLPSLIGPT